MAEFSGNDLNAGHRRRLWKRFSDSGVSALADHEKLELLLFSAIIRRDVKPLAKRLLLRFGSLARVLDAEKKELMSVEGVGERAADVIRFSRELMTSYLEQKTVTAECIASGAAAADFVRLKLGGARFESIMVLYLDSQNKLLCCDVANGTVDRAAIYPRNIAKRALEVGATAMILAHNHPSGDCFPSEEDINVTRLLAATVANLDIRVLDHLIVTPAAFSSLAAMGLLKS
ncbi:MAG: DNA repair protein RadC [Victivallaceae bacterium]|nr:DNA repair protein RadC [Victivallaceae bacterium]